jgi:two-component system chemotaxis response regulator CheB
VTLETSNENAELQISPASFPDRRGAGDILMISLAEKMGSSAMAVVLSGASKDGAEGAHEIIHMGGAALVQSPETCLLKEMSEAALERCGGAYTIPDDRMASEITRLIRADV